MIKLRFAVKVAYLGFYYEGYQRQKHTRNTIEEKIIDALKKAGYLRDVKRANFQSASRTDKGVSALGQTVAFTTSKNQIHLGRINHFLPKYIRTWAFAEVSDKFNPRREAIIKHYTYIVFDEDIISIEKLLKVASLLEGKQYDFKYLSIKDKVERNTILAIDRIRISRKDKLIFIDFFGKRFLYGQIRKLVSLMKLYSNNKISLDDVRDVLNGKKIKVSIAPANASNLILREIYYKRLKFNVEEGIVLKIIRSFSEYYKEYRIKSEIGKLLVNDLENKKKTDL